MNKPIKIQSITIQSSTPLTPEQAQRLAQTIREKNERELRDYEIYMRGVRAGRGIFGGIL